MHSFLQAYGCLGPHEARVTFCHHHVVIHPHREVSLKHGLDLIDASRFCLKASRYGEWFAILHASSL